MVCCNALLLDDEQLNLPCQIWQLSFVCRGSLWRAVLDSMIRGLMVFTGASSVLGCFQGVDQLGKPTDRDQWSWVFFNDAQKYFVTDRKPQKYFPKSKTLVTTLLQHYSFRLNMIIKICVD